MMSYHRSVSRPLSSPLASPLASRLAKGLTLSLVLSAALSGCFFRGRQAAAPVVENDGETISVPSDVENAVTNVRITVPDGWDVIKDGRRRSNDIYATYLPKELYVAVLSESRSVLSQFNLANNAEQYRWLIRAELDRFEEESSTGMTTLNGNPAVQYEIRGVVNGQPVVYLHTTVQGRDNYYQVVGWTTESSYRDNKETLKAIIGSFQGSASPDASLPKLR
jgi:hypothetical protein